MILVSLLSLGYILYPIIFIYIFPPQIRTISTLKGTFITIPKIHAQAPIILNVDPFNEAIYRSALMKGVAQAKNTSLPGEEGTIYLFAHSSGMPWETTHYNTIFLRLGELTKADLIYITYNNKQYIYKVINKKEIWPNEISYLIQTNKNQLILQTCTPIGTSLKRLLIFAQAISS